MVWLHSISQDRLDELWPVRLQDPLQNRAIVRYVRNAPRIPIVRHDIRALVEEHLKTYRFVSHHGPIKQTKTAVPERIHVCPRCHGRGNRHPVATIDGDG